MLIDKLMNNKEGILQKKTSELIKLYNQGQLSDLINEAKKLINQYPQAFIIWNLLGAANKRLGNIDQAFASLKKVTELNPEYADGHNNLGVILQDLGKFDDSINSFNRALLLKPNSINSLFLRKFKLVPGDLTNGRAFSIMGS